MLTINLPSIAVQKVENGFVVEWTKPIPQTERIGSERTKRVAAVATSEPQLVALIQEAAKDIEKI